MTTTINYADAFATGEYMSFRDSIAKASLDNKIHVKDGALVLGKNKFVVPYFVNYLNHIEQLEKERATLLMNYNDLYEKIIISDKPEKFKYLFDDVVVKIHNIEVQIDELRTFIATKNQGALSDKLKQEIDNNNKKASLLLDTSKQNIVTDNAVTKDVIALYKTNLNLHSSLNDAKHILPFDYIIVKRERTSHDKALKHTTLTKRQRVKGAVKKLMIDKLQ